MVPIAMPLAAAGGAALVGAVGWALLLNQAGYEIGWIAWGIGALVGWVAVKVGGRGRMLAVGAAVLTVSSIFAGKLLGYHLQIGASAGQMADQEALAYDEYVRDASDWAELCASGQPTPEKVRGFMSTHEYVEPGKEPIPDEQLDFFLASMAPRLQWIQTEKPSPDEFRARSESDLRAMVYAEASLPELVAEDLNLIDALFVFLGISTAFGLVMRNKADASGGPPTPEQAS
jgi:hypothetical protein